MELNITNLTKEFKDITAVRNISYTMSTGVYGLLGVNGAGKTTLLRMLCGVLKPTFGRICLDGKAIEELGERYYLVTKSHYNYVKKI